MEVIRRCWCGEVVCTVAEYSQTVVVGLCTQLILCVFSRLDSHICYWPELFEVGYSPDRSKNIIGRWDVRTVSWNGSPAVFSNVQLLLVGHLGNFRWRIYA